MRERTGPPRGMCAEPRLDRPLEPSQQLCSLEGPPTHHPSNQADMHAWKSSHLHSALADSRAGPSRAHLYRSGCPGPPAHLAKEDTKNHAEAAPARVSSRNVPRPTFLPDAP